MSLHRLRLLAAAFTLLAIAGPAGATLVQFDTTANGVKCLSGCGGSVPATIVTGQYKVTASAAAIASSTALVNGVVIKAKATNTGSVWIGSSGVTNTDDGTGAGYKLLPGEAISFAVSDVHALFAIGTANDVIYFAGN